MEEDILAELPDGRILQFPPNTSPEVIQAAVKRELGITDDAAPEQPRIGPTGRALLGATERGLEALATSEGPRMQNVREAFGATLRGEQTPREAILQAGSQVPAYLGDLIGEGLGYVGRGVSAITPDVLEDEVINQLGIFMDQPLMRYGMQALGSGMEQYQQFAQEYPRAARNIEALANIGFVGGGGKVAKEQGGRLLADVGTVAAEEAGRIRRTAQTPARRQAAQDIESGGIEAINVRTAPYRLEEAPSGATTTVGPEGPVQPRPQMQAVVSPPQTAALRSGWDEGLVAMIRESSPQDRRNMLESMTRMERGRQDTRSKMLDRSTDIAGQSMLDRYKSVLKANRQAGQSLGRYARNNLKGNRVDFGSAIDNFVGALDEIGVTVKPDLTLDFSAADIAGISGAERVLKNIVKRMSQGRNIDAYEIHKMKKYIDELVTYGTQNLQKPLTGETLNIVKGLRRDLNEVLSENFEGYRAANQQYAETIDALDNFKDAMGTVNYDSSSAARALGTRLRGLGSNAQYRALLLDSIDEMQTLSNKYGGKFDDDVINQTAFTIELDKMFGTEAPTSFSGQIGEAVGQSQSRAGAYANVARATARRAADAALGRDEQSQIRAMRELLLSFD